MENFISSRRPLLYKISFLVYFLPILGGQKVAVSELVEGWCAAGNLGACRVSIRMDDRMDGQRDDGMDGRRDRFRGSFISSRCPLIVSSILSSVATIRPDSGEVSFYYPFGFKGSFIRCWHSFRSVPKLMSR
jgi:hypothetical protein